MKRTSGAVRVAVTVVLALALGAWGGGGGSNDDVLGLREPSAANQLIEIAQLMSSRLP